MKILFFSAVGSGSHHLMQPIFKVLAEQNIDIVVGAYDASYSPPPGVVMTTHRAEGMSKWQMATRFLNPSLLQNYTHLFVWDDDLAIGSFDPTRFCQIMESNHLDVAQPAITSRFRLSHEITRPKPWGAKTSSGSSVVGRYTNFVEIMAPVFTSAFWGRVSAFMNDLNPEGLGYDYIPIGTKGIVDIMPVEHTRPVRKKPFPFYKRRNEFFERNGFEIYPHLELGKLTYFLKGDVQDVLAPAEATCS